MAPPRVRRRQQQVRLTEGTIRRLDELGAQMENASRSDVIRHLMAKADPKVKKSEFEAVPE